jgi:hypothetical protein
VKTTKRDARSEMELTHADDKSATDKGANASERTWVHNGPRSNRPRDFFAARVRDDGLWWRESLAYLQENLLRAGAYKRGRRNIYTQNKGSMSVGDHRTQATSKEEHITHSLHITPFPFRKHTSAGNGV